MSTKRIKNIREAFYAIPVINTSWQKTPDGAPFNYTTAKTGTINDIITGKAERSEEEVGLAPKVLPFPLDRILEPLSQTYESLVKTKSILSESIKSGIFSDKERKLLKTHIKKIDVILNYLKGNLMSDIGKVEI